MTVVRVKRIHESRADDDGPRVLVDRLWPRGVTRERAAVDVWLREVAPSGDLRRWYGHAPERAPEFQRRYLLELSRGDQAAALAELAQMARRAGRLTLLTATANVALSHAQVLAGVVADAGTPGADET
jgi:uncharacterized protein YeaO (DUF488 family)